MADYVVSIFSQMDGDNRTFLVNGPSVEVAAKVAILAHCSPEYKNQDYKDWVEGLGEDFETIANGAAQGELILSVPLSLNSLTTLAKVNHVKNGQNL